MTLLFIITIAKHKKSFSNAITAAPEADITQLDDDVIYAQTQYSLWLSTQDHIFFRINIFFY